MTIIKKTKDPAARLDYKFDLTAYLEGDDTVASATATSSDDALTVEEPSFDGSTITVWVSGGELTETYTVKVQFTTSVGRIDERSFRLTISDF